jgi:hypothetical protein
MSSYVADAIREATKHLGRDVNEESSIVDGLHDIADAIRSLAKAVDNLKPNGSSK